jgi:hypothetical protein
MDGDSEEMKISGGGGVHNSRGSESLSRVKNKAVNYSSSENIGGVGRQEMLRSISMKYDDTLPGLDNFGLENMPGHLNCFLNVIMQALWHLNPVRSLL